MDRQPDRARLIHDRALDGLSNPPGRIGGEAEAAFGIEFLDRSNEAKIAFLNEVQEGQPAVDVTARDLHNETQIALVHPFAARFHAPQ